MPLQKPAPLRASRHRTPLADITNSKTKANRVTNLKCEVRHILQKDGVPHEAVQAIVKATGQMLNGKQCTTAAKRGGGFNSGPPQGLPGPGRSKAPADPPRELLLQNLAACHESKETWHGIKSTKQGYAVYRDATEAVEKEVLDGIVMLHFCPLSVRCCLPFVLDCVAVVCNSVGQSAKLTKHFREPKGPAISRKEWAIGNKDTKALLKNDIFWQRLANLLPTARDGLTVSHPELSAAEIAEPFQCYLRLVRYLARDLISCNPQGVETRDADGRKMHVLFQSFSLSPRRWSVGVHYFTEHYTDHLRRHGNLQGLCSEGGEHLHHPHARLVERRPSKPSWKCPVGLVAIPRWGARTLRLWGARVLVPLVACAETPTFPAS